MSRKTNQEPDSKFSLPNLWRWLFFRVLIVLGVFLLSFGLYSLVFSSKIYANQYYSSINIGLKSQKEAKEILKKETDFFLNNTIVLSLAGTDKSYEVKLPDIGLNYNVDQMVEEGWRYGRGGHPWPSFFQQLRSVFAKNKLPLIYSFNQNNLDEKISKIAHDLDEPEKDFTFNYNEGKFHLSSERKPGRRINQTKIKQAILSSVALLGDPKISFSIEEFIPQVKKENAESRLTEANKLVEPGDLTLHAGGQEFKLDPDTIGGFVKTQVKGEDLEIIFDDNRIKLFIQSIAKSVDVDPANAKLTVDNGKVTVFQPSREGKTLDQSQAMSDIKGKLLSRISGQGDLVNLDLKIAVKKPEVTSSDVSNLGINDLVGTATTDFKTSPANRVHNIAIGASALNGVMLKPDEEFSTLGHLGTIDASSGYLEELVIKNDKTVPDFGGGLCQVSSTLFRATMNAGLKIIERYNHSYRVSYYEPPVGMDATIFDPSPDFKFINNFKSYILIQSHIEGTKITFDIYGTKDNRKVEISTPVVSNIIDPPPAITAETDTLESGQRKQTQKAHQGATADFHYKVTSSDNEVLQDKNFHSVYNAIPEQWLVGTGPAPTPNCSDGQQNGDETGLDCGGSGCLPCAG